MERPNLPRGILIPLITPFDAAGELDVVALGQLTDFYAETGVQAIFALGSAGQGLVMTPDQRRRALETIIAVTGRRVPVVAHVGAADAFSGRDLARHAAESGADAIAIVPPFYYSDHTELEIVAHFGEIADAAPELPVIIYDNPKYSGIELSPRLALELRRRVPAIAGMKAAFASIDYMLGYLEQLPDLKMYAGSIQHLADTAPRGIAGAINPPSSVFPELCAALWHAISNNRADEAKLLQQRVNALGAVVGDYIRRLGRSAVTEVMRMRGFEVVRYPRWTTHAFTSGERQQLRDALTAAGGGPYLEGSGRPEFLAVV
jgi:dihydrodipicolinate synthase/N-acetylneuraminate lyase